MTVADEFCEFCGKEKKVHMEDQVKCNLGFQHYPCKDCKKKRGLR